MSLPTIGDVPLEETCPKCEGKGGRIVGVRRVEWCSGCDGRGVMPTPAGADLLWFIKTHVISKLEEIE